MLPVCPLDFGALIDVLAFVAGAVGQPLPHEGAELAFSSCCLQVALHSRTTVALVEHANTNRNSKVSTFLVLFQARKRLSCQLIL